MSEDRDDVLMRSLMGGSAAPMGDETFVQGVMGRVAKDAAAAQARVTWLTWIGVAVAAFLGAANFTAIVAELSRSLEVAAASTPMPALNGSATVLLLVALGAGGAYLFSERS